MKKDKREIYLILTAEVDAGLGGFCKYHHCWGSACDGGYAECEHPLQYRVPHYDDSECECPNTDCWGFRPRFKVSDVADIVGIVLAEGYLDWGWWQEDGQILVSGTRKRELSLI